MMTSLSSSSSPSSEDQNDEQKPHQYQHQHRPFNSQDRVRIALLSSLPSLSSFPMAIIEVVQQYAAINRVWLVWSEESPMNQRQCMAMNITELDCDDVIATQQQQQKASASTTTTAKAAAAIPSFGLRMTRPSPPSAPIITGGVTAITSSWSSWGGATDDQSSSWVMRWGGVHGIIKNRLYMVAGSSATNHQPSNVDVIDITTGTPSSDAAFMRDIPVARAAPVCCIIRLPALAGTGISGNSSPKPDDEWLFVCGGLASRQLRAIQQPLNECHAYNPRTNLWATLPPMNVARHSSTIAVWQGN
jgi:hypothetical protein